MLPNFTSNYFTFLHITLFFFISLHFSSYYFTFLHFTLLFFISRYFPSYHVTFLHITLLSFISRYFSSNHVTHITLLSFISPNFTSNLFTFLHITLLYLSSYHFSFLITLLFFISLHFTFLHITSLHFSLLYFALFCFTTMNPDGSTHLSAQILFSDDSSNIPFTWYRKGRELTQYNIISYENKTNDTQTEHVFQNEASLSFSATRLKPVNWAGDLGVTIDSYLSCDHCHFGKHVHHTELCSR